MIGEVDRGWYHILTTLNNERILVAALATGVLRGVLEDSIAYARERRAFGHAIGDFQIIQHWIAEMAMKLAQAELLTYKAAWLYDNGHDAMVESSMAKAIAAEYATWAADRGLQILGGMGYAAEFDMQRYWRDVRLYQIGPVTNEMVRNIIAQNLGLERSSEHGRLDRARDLPAARDRVRQEQRRDRVAGGPDVDAPRGERVV